MRPVYVAALILLAAPLAAAQDSKEIPVGQIETGETYLRNCPDVHPNMPFEEVLEANYCFGYLRGMLSYNNILRVYPGLNLFCPPKDLTNTQADAMLRKYLKEHPDKQTMPTLALAARALADEYPCPATTPPPSKK